MIINQEKNRVFKINSDKTNAICPPEQIFKKSNFKFLLTIGGDLTDNVTEYNNLMTFLKELDETEFYVLENIGATLTDRNMPFFATLPTDSDFHYFQNKVKTFDPPFGWTSNHFYVFGQNENWGIYICENPTINIIGCGSKLTERFASIFGINGDGFQELKDFVEKEFQTNANLIKQLIDNYKLEVLK